MLFTKETIEASFRYYKIKRWGWESGLWRFTWYTILGGGRGAWIIYNGGYGEEEVWQGGYRRDDRKNWRLGQENIEWRKWRSGGLARRL